MKPIDEGEEHPFAAAVRSLTLGMMQAHIKRIESMMLNLPLPTDPAVRLEIALELVEEGKMTREEASKMLDVEIP